ncbi:MAG: DnaJ domain-containing protein [Myxococcales bacterium]|nr:DnaJ domain-containing protein [Myxococcales bacterium]
MATRDYYNILGVERGASSDDIKRAYRVLARRWHPDRNQDDADADTRFKDITEAYRTLSDPEKRVRYDRLGPLYTEDGRPPRPEDINEVVGNVWNNIFRRKKGDRGEDLRYTASLSLEEVATGTDKEVVVPRFVRCATCDGDGADPEGGKETCEVCSGSGRATGPRILSTSCYHCKGKGYNVVQRCSSCGGDGRQGVEDTIRVKVNPGVSTGQKLKVAGKGNAARGEGESGDLYVIVSVEDHPLFRRRGDDLLIELPLTFLELTEGADVSVPTLEGTTTIRIPSGSEPGKVLRLAERGLPKLGGTTRGDLHIQLMLEVPADLTPERVAALRDWADQLPPSAHPRRAQFDKLVEDRG